MTLYDVHASKSLQTLLFLELDWESIYAVTCTASVSIVINRGGLSDEVIVPFGSSGGVFLGITVYKYKHLGTWDLADSTGRRKS